MDKNFRIYLIQKGRSCCSDGLAQMGGEGFHEKGCLCKAGLNERAEMRETVRVFLPRN